MTAYLCSILTDKNVWYEGRLVTLLVTTTTTNVDITSYSGVHMPCGSQLGVRISDYLNVHVHIRSYTMYIPHFQRFLSIRLLHYRFHKSLINLYIQLLNFKI